MDLLKECPQLVGALIELQRPGSSEAELYRAAVDFYNSGAPAILHFIRPLLLKWVEYCPAADEHVEMVMKYVGQDVADWYGSGELSLELGRQQNAEKDVDL